MSPRVQLVFDTNILVDMLLARGAYYRHGVQLLDRVAAGELEGWYAPHSLTTVYYLVERTLAAESAHCAESGAKAKKLLQALAQVLKPLPQVGDEILQLGGEPGDDLEDELIVHLAAAYLPNPLILTRDKWFLQRAKVQAAHPKEVVEMGLRAWAPADDRIEFVDLAAQQRAIRPQLEHRIHRVLHHGQYIMGPEVKELEDALAAHTGARHCITVASGTEALLIALMALGVGLGDEVITSPFTFAATAEVIALLGAVPVFVDVEPDTCNIDARLVEAAITPRTKAIMPVSLYGQVADMDEINAIAARHGGIPVVEDAAQSFGAAYRGRKSCNLSTVGCTSFFPSKPLGCYGDGGALFTSDDALAQAAREIRVHGQPRRYVHTRLGVGGRMDTLQCAVVLAKLGRFDAELQARDAAAQRYDALLEAWTGRLQRPVLRPDRSCAWAQYTVQLPAREAVAERLRAAGVPTAVHYPVPLHVQPAYAARCRVAGPLAHAEALAQGVLSLPLHPALDEPTQQRVVRALGDAVG